MKEPTVFHSLSYDDAPAAAEFLAAAFGFVANGIYTDPDDPSKVMHAQMDWPPGGGIMFGSSRRHGELWVDSVGRSQCYCVTDTDEDVDRVFDRAVAAGATVVRRPEDQDYGGRAARCATLKATSGASGPTAASDLTCVATALVIRPRLQGELDGLPPTCGRGSARRWRPGSGC